MMVRDQKASLRKTRVRNRQRRPTAEQRQQRKAEKKRFPVTVRLVLVCCTTCTKKTRSVPLSFHRIPATLSRSESTTRPLAFPFSYLYIPALVVPVSVSGLFFIAYRTLSLLVPCTPSFAPHPYSHTHTRTHAHTNAIMHLSYLVVCFQADRIVILVIDSFVFSDLEVCLW